MDTKVIEIRKNLTYILDFHNDVLPITLGAKLQFIPEVVVKSVSYKPILQI